MTDSGLTIKTATGVDLNMRIAGPGARSYAYCIDWHIRVLLAVTLFFGLSYLTLGAVRVPDSGSDERDLFLYLVIALPSAVYLLYHPVIELITKGRTPGKRIAGVRIVTQNAQTPGSLAILIRNVLRILDSLPIAYLIGLLSTFFTRNSVRIGDIAAGTLLVYEGDERGKRNRRTRISPETVGRYGVELTEVSQDLLDRWNQLESGKRLAMGAKLLARLDPEATPSDDPDSLRDQISSALNGPGAGSGR